MIQVFENIFGQDYSVLTWWQMCNRTILIFFLAVLFVRIAGMRMFGLKSAFDQITAITLGAVLARTIPGSSPLFPTILCGLLMVLLHRLLASAAFYSNKVGKVIKGESQLLYANQEILWKNMQQHNISEKDLMEAVRKSGHVNSLEDVHEAYFERNGEISIILKK